MNLTHIILMGFLAGAGGTPPVSVPGTHSPYIQLGGWPSASMTVLAQSPVSTAVHASPSVAISGEAHPPLSFEILAGPSHKTTVLEVKP